MICVKTQIEFPLADSGESSKPPPKQKPQDATVASEAALKAKAYRLNWKRTNKDKVSKHWKTWYAKNRVKRKEYQKNYCAENRESIHALQTSPRVRARRKKIYAENIEKRRAYHKQWEREHKDRTKAYHIRKYAKDKARLKTKRSTPEYKSGMSKYLKKYRAEHPEEIRQLNKNWRNENRDHMRDYIKRRKAEDPLFALVDRIRARIRNAFKNGVVKKPSRSEVLLGCSFEHAKAHVENQFTGEMSWKNRSSFEIDHIVPICVFNIADAEELACAFSWKNLQPLKPIDNWKKNDTLPNPLPSWLPPHIAARIIARSVPASAYQPPASPPPPARTPSTPI